MTSPARIRGPIRSPLQPAMRSALAVRGAGQPAVPASAILVGGQPILVNGQPIIVSA